MITLDQLKAQLRTMRAMPIVTRAAPILLSPLLFFILSTFSLAPGAFYFASDALGYAVILALLMTTAMAWELRVLGDPHNPVQWPKHLLLFITLTLFFAQTLTLPTPTELPVYQPTPFGWFGDAAVQLLHELVKLIPDGIIRFFLNWRISIALFLFFCAMCVRQLPFRLCALGAILVIPWVLTLLDSLTPGLFFGGLFLFGALVRLFQPTPVLALQSGAIKLQPLAPHDPAFVVSAIRILDLVKDGRAHPYSEIEAIHPQAEAQVDRMIHLGLLEMQQTHEGKHVQFAKTLLHTSPLALFSRLPRAIFLLTIVCIWVALPVDLIPDSIPFIGSLDDITLSILALKSLREDA